MRCQFFFSGLGSIRKQLEDRQIQDINELLSYADLRDKKDAFDFINKVAAKRKLVMIDSGAYSVLNSGKVIDLNHFIQWHKQLERECPSIFLKVGLDDILNWENSKANQLACEAAGVKLFPTYHGFDSPKWLKWILESETEFMGLGGMAKSAADVDALRSFMDRAFEQICDSEGKPTKKVHLFGVSNVNLVHQFPAWSNDSSTSGSAARYGEVFIPALDPYSGQPDWAKSTYRLTVSSESNKRADSGAHFESLPLVAQEHIRKFVESFGFTMTELGARMEARTCFCVVMTIEQANHYPEDLLFKKQQTDVDLFV